MQQRFSLQIGVPFRLRQIEFFALTLLATNRALTHKQISLALAIAPSNMVGIMAALEERDLVMRQANPSDGRSFFWCLTVAGDELLERAKTAVARMEAGALADTESAREELTNGLDELWSREPSF
ncbi:MarR family winged helix-turn-helix transcriptional regulator [Salinisphaera hydrothermalis]|uniref:MarR family winged helix-turn-helix transcriptional regulator n=1 Tax=Salinisphaera hydrothermalis TaxID=563188 RepID=UPI003341041C